MRPRNGQNFCRRIEQRIRLTFLLVVIMPAFILSLSLDISFPDPALLIDTSLTRSLLEISGLVVISSSSSWSSTLFSLLSFLSLVVAPSLLKASDVFFTSPSSTESYKSNSQWRSGETIIVKSIVGRLVRIETVPCNTRTCGECEDSSVVTTVWLVPAHQSVCRWKTKYWSNSNILIN